MWIEYVAVMNKKKNRKLLLVAFLLLSQLFTSCLKDEDRTIVLFGEEGYIKGFQEVFGMAANSNMDVDTLGIMPPDVRGEFEFACRETVYPSEFESPEDTVYFRFGDGENGADYLHGQHHMIVHCDIKIPGLDLNAATFRTDTAYVRGSGNFFTVYLQREEEVRTHYLGHMVRYMLTQEIAISGKRTGGQSDITDAQLALYNKDIQVRNVDELEPEVVDAINSMKGKLFVFRDSDHLTKFNGSGNQPFINWEE